MVDFAVAGRQSEPTIPTELHAALTRRAELHADLVGRYLTQTLALTERRFPAVFLLELAAVLQIGLWERQGVHKHLATNVPSYAEAAAELAARANRGTSEFAGLCNATLLSRVLHAAICDLAWEGPEMLGAEFAVDVDEEDELINLLGDFVWNNRTELNHLAEGDNQRCENE